MIGRVIEWFILAVLVRAFPSRWRVIPHAVTGDPMLRQFKVFELGPLACYLQSWLVPEDRNWFHVHRWRRTFSVVMSGDFVEERYPGGERFYILHEALSCYCMDHTTIHRIVGAAPRTWTAFFMYRDRGQGWGYFERPSVKFTPWNEFIPETRKVSKL